MIGWHHRLNGHEYEPAPGDREGQGSLVCCSPQGHRVRRDLTTAQHDHEVALSAINWQLPWVLANYLCMD